MTSSGAAVSEPPKPMGSELGPRSYRDGARAVAALAVAVVGFGISFGLLARSARMGALAPIVMSATTFAGSAQFAAASILGASGGVWAAVAAGALLNARYGPIGLSVAPALNGPPVWRFLQAQLVVDESWAISADGRGGHDRKKLIGAGLTLYVAWVGGTTIGAIGAQAIGDPAGFGLDAAFPALFLALLIPQVRTRRALAASLAGGAIALLLTPVTAPGVPIIGAAAACALGWRRA